MPTLMVSPGNHFCCAGFLKRFTFHSGEGSTPTNSPSTSMPVFAPKPNWPMKRAMAGVNKEGTGARAFAGAAYVSAGKTGTAQVVALKPGEKYSDATVAEHLRDHALFIAFAPVEKPTIALAVLVENAGFGARAAAPVARQVLDFYLLGKDIKKPAERAPAIAPDDDGDD